MEKSKLTVEGKKGGQPRAGRAGKRIPKLLPAPLAAGGLVCAGSFFFDGRVMGWVAAHQDRGIEQAARYFTRWGDFPPILVLLLLLLLATWLLKRVLSRLLLLMIGSASAAGLAANVLRVLTGRARPSAAVPPGWYGLRDHGAWVAGQFQYSSFPSAHTAVAIGCVVPLWILLPARGRIFIALPATCLALCVGASRIVLNAHHLSDVLAAAWLGIFISSLICSRFATGSCPG